MSDVNAIYFQNQTFKNIAATYAKKYNLPLTTNIPLTPFINISDESFISFDELSLKNNFNKGSFKNRIINFQRENLLKKAIGHKKKPSKKILDVTGGLGHDSFLFALLGHEVTLVERNTGLCILFEEALRNLPKTTYFEKAKSKINVLNKNSEKFLNELDIYDVIYVDPMFDIKSKAGRSGQLNTMQRYLSDQSDVSITLMEGNFKRMVIKRPISFNHSKSLKPQITVKGKAVVFHVFLKNPNN
ncbi:MAG: hypothetical protein CMD89_00150 [Gammaproteobacteria bacterium]|nr:hypothetical protein [Gammaproteobacteria bacterium]|tara:strand:+ start:3920 stop:4651 length:732 start_codon:yes stop_codon:yes gene_type:complete